MHNILIIIITEIYTFWWIYTISIRIWNNFFSFQEKINFKRKQIIEKIFPFFAGCVTTTIGSAEHSSAVLPLLRNLFLAALSSIICIKLADFVVFFSSRFINSSVLIISSLRFFWMLSHLDVAFSRSICVCNCNFRLPFKALISNSLFIKIFSIAFSFYESYSFFSFFVHLKINGLK